MSGEFYVLLTVQPGMILVNNQLDAQFFIYVFMYVYFYSLHVSGNHLLIIRRIIVSMRQLVYVTVYRWPSGMQEHMLLHTRRVIVLTFRHHASYIGQAYRQTPEYAFYIFSQQILLIIFFRLSLTIFVYFSTKCRVFFNVILLGS